MQYCGYSMCIKFQFSAVRQMLLCYDLVFERENLNRDQLELKAESTQSENRYMVCIPSQGGDAWQDVEDQTTQRAHVSMSQAFDQSPLSCKCGQWPVASNCGLDLALIYTPASSNVSSFYSLFQYSQWRSSPRKTQLRLRRRCLHPLRLRPNPRNLGTHNLIVHHRPSRRLPLKLHPLLRRGTVIINPQ